MNQTQTIDIRAIPIGVDIVQGCIHKKFFYCIRVWDDLVLKEPRENWLARWDQIDN